MSEPMRPVLEPVRGVAREVWALDTGRLNYDAGAVMVGGAGMISAPVPSFLIRHERGLVLFDTGLDPEAAGEPERVYGPIAEFMGMEFSHEQRIDEQLGRYGFETGDVTHVVISHAHLDHTGGMRLFPAATFYMGLADLRYVFWPDPALGVACRWSDIEPVRGARWRPVTGDLDLFGDGSIVLLSMPGHTPGNYSLLVRLESRTVILTGDTVHLQAGLELCLPGGGDHDTAAAVGSIRRLVQEAESRPADVWVSHDPDDLKRFGGYGLLGSAG